MLKLKLGSKGELIIPKKVREQLGLIRNKTIILEVKEKSAEIRAASEDLLKRWEETAKKEGTDVSKNFIYGDKLYEEVF